MGGGGSRPADAKATLTIANHDTGFLSQALIERLRSERLNIVEIDPQDREATPDKIRTLVIPSGFTDSVLAGDQVTLRLEKEPDTSTEAALAAQARIVAAISRLIGQLVEVTGESGEAPDEETFAAHQPAADLIRVETRFAGTAEVAPGGFAHSIPGNTVMFVMLVALTYGAGAISGERQGGQLRRLLTTPLSRAEVVLGKILGRFVVAAVQITVLVVVGVIAHHTVGVEIGDDPLGVYVVLLVYATAVAPLGVLFGAWFRDPDRAANVGVLCTLIMAALGGCWWPIEIVSRPLQRLALAFPTGWAMNALHGVISFGRGLGDLGTELVVLVAFAAALSLAASRSLRVE
jgi:ABC-type multidrug transport system permease subunit